MYSWDFQGASAVWSTAPFSLILQTHENAWEPTSYLRGSEFFLESLLEVHRETLVNRVFRGNVFRNQTSSWRIVLQAQTRGFAPQAMLGRMHVTAKICVCVCQPADRQSPAFPVYNSFATAVCTPPHTSDLKL